MELNARTFGFFLGPLAGFILGTLLLANGFNQTAALTAGVTAWVVIWWILEPIPIPVTSLLPLMLLPMFGALPMTKVSTAYGHPLVLLLLGGFVLSTAMERSGAHRRIALNIVRIVGGGNSRRVVFGFMLASAFLSMWISNTATTLMLLPVALAVLEKATDEKLRIPLLLGIAHAASVGGIGTPIGTPPNIVLMGAYQEFTGHEIAFAQWMLWGVPVVILLVPLIGIWLTRKLSYTGPIHLPELGTWTKAEKRVLTVFTLTALAWIFRSAPFGGWTALLDLPYTNDAMVAFAAVILLFSIPDGNRGRLLDWETANKIPWGMLLLFGAGITIASAFQETGLSEALAESLSALSMLPVLFIIVTICMMVTFLTEATSNTATTTLLMPILAATAVAMTVDHKLLMVPAAMSASCAFMLPVATPPNLVVYSTGQFKIITMVREGFILNLIGVVVISLLCYLYFHVLVT